MAITGKQLNGRLVTVYTEAFRRMVIEEYLGGGVSKMSLLRKYDIKIKSGIQRWMKLYGYTDKAFFPCTFRVKYAHALVRKMNTQKASKQQLEEKVRELEGQLQQEKLRSEAYQRIIEKAEKELQVPIRKKPASR